MRYTNCFCSSRANMHGTALQQTRGPQMLTTHAMNCFAAGQKNANAINLGLWVASLPQAVAASQLAPVSW